MQGLPNLGRGLHKLPPFDFRGQYSSCVGAGSCFLQLVGDVAVPGIGIQMFEVQ